MIEQQLKQENKQLKRENKKQQKMIDDLEHKVNHSITKMSIIKSHSKCCRNSANQCDGCLACCG